MKTIINISQGLTLITVIGAAFYMLLDIMIMHPKAMEGITELAKTFPH